MGSRGPVTMQEVLAGLKRHEGVTVERGGKHYKVKRNGKTIASMPVSGSDWRGVRNTVSQLRRLGIDLRATQ